MHGVLVALGIENDGSGKMISATREVECFVLH